VRAGALLDAERKARLKAINEELSLTAVKFGQNLLAENNNYALELASSDLDGIPATARDLAREKAEAMGRKGKYVFTLHKPSLIPFLTYSSKRELREQIYKAYLNRCNNGDEYDNKQLINDFIRLRTEKAHLLGYPSYAAYVVDDEMAGTTDAVYGLLEEIWTPALESAKGELAEMEELFRKDFPEGEFASWDWWYYAEKVRKQKYALDEEMLRPYFSLENVQGGIFFLANRLYGITFRPIVVPLYHPEAVAYEVLDVDQSHLGVLYFDYFPRDGKSQGAWCGNYVEQTYEDGKRVAPVVSVVCNFTRPAGGNPALLTLDETETLFHEFGHALHFLFHDVKYRGLAEVEGDFVELPSQLMENWAFDPEVLKQYAVHYRSNEVIPKYLVDKLRRSELFNQGFMATELIAASLSDMDIHSITEYEPFDPMAFERKALTEKRGLIPQIEPRYRYPYFSHIFDGGYSAGYYFYTWAEVLDKDAFEAFRESGDLFNKKIAGDFRRKILARGGSEDGMTMYRDFRGKDPDKRAMLRGRGLLNEPEPSGEDAAPAAETASAAREN
jgi:peptidyl-dipeptidase dcp . metallo peptidase. MEROPS family M03A